MRNILLIQIIYKMPAKKVARFFAVRPAKKKLLQNV